MSGSHKYVLLMSTGIPAPTWRTDLYATTPDEAIASVERWAADGQFPQSAVLRLYSGEHFGAVVVRAWNCDVTSVLTVRKS
jgi:hypothetical protein